MLNGQKQRLAVRKKLGGGGHTAPCRVTQQICSHKDDRPDKWRLLQKIIYVE